MSCGNCDSKNMRLCPFSFGLAVGIVCGLAMFFWSLWVIKYGMPPMMVEKMMTPPNFTSGVVFSLLALLKGFLFGFFVALVYDLIACCCKSRSCKSDDESCECDSKTKIGKFK